ncbi:hypothetical protein [Deinococcus actinosclerus]|uniref:AraC family transcriptional regulator n=1 Tax=Deinococcus actinosclerus TaxID=1768108 RepID=A0ABM5X8S2_9DEIO|nr:hypothetical protein [Deinococcus actinosclerus]ALW90134.1 hypothetical protein AUC44_15575 [Deinococcus actinosclerus]
MTLHDPPTLITTPVLLVPTAPFERVGALPQRHTVPGAELLVFQFANGYGAAVTRQLSRPEESAFEFCVLDCMQPTPQPCFSTTVATSFVSGLSREGTEGLLMLTERLGLHPLRVRANSSLLDEDF